MLSDTAEFAASVESLMRQTLGVPLDAEVSSPLLKFLYQKSIIN